MKKAKSNKAPSDEYKRFESFVKTVIAVPKSELDRREAEYQKAKKVTKKQKAA